MLTTNGSVLTPQDGATPTGFDQTVSVLNNSTLLGSTLDIDGQTPQQYDVNTDPILVSSLLQSQLDGYNGQIPPTYQNQVLLGVNMLVNTTLPGSILDNDGQTPTQYINNLPG